ncbi:hypothetical protein KBZ20_10440 [Vulcanococcus limneticus Candia 3F8]|uniref:hypothetical protein n=1 Tax=Vulcanococcus limneticus TaxID=2170428 RepID=UPI000B98A14D|nr:hypothetical protein [Vulcanococcus limneticus]MCP9792558.1 hypothetical protein [Vulcanococcus limneticus MW73D5]MCP9894189.1 hypothetical protein [Vulcanococcus limneticus Candia 3F8]MCP9897950.1 hypothetical protein [Vulcanococcus limneticus Candia 3B3]
MHPNARPLAEAQRQLQLLQRQQDQLAPALYRDLALYLQVLREGLLPAVQQACFHLATQVHPERYARLDAEQRRALQERLRELCQRCCCLLTVEQLLSLANQLERQRQRRERAEQRRLLEALAADAGEADGAGDGTALPEGSISLGLDLPLSADLFLEGMPGLADLLGLTENAESAQDLDGPSEQKLRGEEAPEAAAADTAAASPDTPPQAPRTPACSPNPEESGVQDAQRQSVFQALFAMAAEGLGQPGSAGLRPTGGPGLPGVPVRLDGERADHQRDGEEQGNGEGDDDGQEPDPSAATVLERSSAPEASDSSDGLLPRDPAALLRWWQQLDRAMERRLRNLSHALNLELMRLRLSRSLLPPNLLDAVLAGQVEAQSAPANLLRLPLPFPDGNGPQGAPPQVLAVLVRSSDLEYEQPRLRRCRRRLEQRRSELRTMAKRHRYWQQRALALQAEQQWLQDSVPTPNP